MEIWLIFKVIQINLTEHKMFQPNRMNQIDNFFMRNNNQVTPKRSYSPRLAPQIQDNQRPGSHLQYFPANKQNVLPNRTSVSPNKMNFVRKPMINGSGSNGGYNVSPSLLVSPRNKNIHQGPYTNVNQGYHNMNGFQRQLNKPQFPVKNQSNGPLSLLKRMNPQNSDVQFVMSKGVQYCENHGNKIAEFWINIEGEKMKYCSICASKLASQGFTVLKLVNQSQKSIGNSIARKPKPIPSYSQYRGNPFYEQIIQFLRQLVNVEGHHYQTITKYKTLQQHYDNQISLTTQYYDQVLKILTQMKQQHLHDLCQQKQKYMQISDIQVDYLNENVQQINYMRQDIQSNIPSIVNDIEQQKFKECVHQYRHKMTLLKHSLEEKSENLKLVTSYEQDQLRKKVQDFQSAMKDLWKEQIDQPKQNNRNAHINKRQNEKSYAESQQPVSIKNMHQMLPKSSVQQTQGQGAFRHLFGDDQDADQTLPIPSPQFKKI